MAESAEPTDLAEGRGTVGAAGRGGATQHEREVSREDQKGTHVSIRIWKYVRATLAEKERQERTICRSLRGKQKAPLRAEAKEGRDPAINAVAHASGEQQGGEKIMTMRTITVKNNKVEEANRARGEEEECRSRGGGSKRGR